MVTLEEENLTPKEWAIRLADNIRKHPSMSAFEKAMASFHSALEAPDIRAFEMIKRSVEKGTLGEDFQALCAKSKAVEGAQLEYGLVRQLIFDVNQIVETRSQKPGLEAALKLQALQTIVLQDSFSRTAKKAAEWIETIATADQDEEENRQIVLKELAAYEFDLNDIEGIGGQTLRAFLNDVVGPTFLSQIEEWVSIVKTLIFELQSYKAYVKFIQDRFLDGHPFLAKDIEADLDNSIRLVADAVRQYNEYLDTRATIFKSEWESDEADGLRVGIGGEREGRLKISLDELTPTKSQTKCVVKAWIDTARDKTLSLIKSDPQWEWQRWRAKKRER